jgi:hypothetical protein
MTHESLCNEQSALVDLLYDECDPQERRRLEAHVAICAACARELRALQAVRTDLQVWTPPEQTLGFRVVQDQTRIEPSSVTSDVASARRTWFVPAWAMAAAAVLVLAVGAAIANVEVRYGADGLTVRTGWKQLVPSTAPARVRVERASTETASPWRADLATLERQLRREFAALPAAPAARPVVVNQAADRASAERDAELLGRVRALIDESERRQQRDLALRLTDVAREFEATRRADLMRIERGLNTLEQQTGVEVGRQREILNYFVRTSTAGNRQ